MAKTSTLKSQKIIIRSAFTQKERVQLANTKPSRTKQQFKDECDINTIINRFLRTGHIETLQRLEPRYGDVTGIEYQSAMQTVAEARTLFNELPAKIRSRFDNEPALFLDFVQNDANKEEAIKLGLIKAEVKVAEAAAPPPKGESPKAASEGPKAA